MDFIYVLKLTARYEDPGNWGVEAGQIMDQHWRYLLGLHRNGTMQLVGRTDYAPGHKDLSGIAVFTAESEEKASEIMSNDPAVVNGMMTAVLHPFRLSLIAGREHTD